MSWAGGVCSVLSEQGHWSDYIDPCSGLAVSNAASLPLPICGSVLIGARVLLPSAPAHYCPFSPPRCLQMLHKEGSQVYSEVEALSILKGYKTANAGCCKVRGGLGWRSRGGGWCCGLSTTGAPHRLQVCKALPNQRLYCPPPLPAGVAAPPVGESRIPSHPVRMRPPPPHPAGAAAPPVGECRIPSHHVHMRTPGVTASRHQAGRGKPPQIERTLLLGVRGQVF